MISVQNHQQPLSGNKILLVGVLFFLVVVMGLQSCARKVIASSPGKDVQIIKADQEPKKDTDRNPKQNNGSQPSKIDTVAMKEVKEPGPIVLKEKKKVVRPSGSNIKDVYNVKVLIPLKSTESNGELIANNRFVQFYAGMLRAFEKLDDEQINLNVEIIDTDSNNPISQQVSTIVNERTDLIIGPFDKEDVKLYADACKYASVTMVSPWYTSSKVTVDNPYYVQLKPNLREHFSKLATSAATDFKSGEVAIVGVNNKEMNAWAEYFQSEVERVTGRKNFFKIHYLVEGSISFTPMLSSGVKAFIFPNYSFSDEGFVSQALKKLSSERGGRSTTVYGMPLMYDSDKIDFDLYKALNIMIVISDFVDDREADIRNFRREFYDLYGEIPSADAVKGYDMMLYLGRNLWKYGREFQTKLADEATKYLLSTYNIVSTHSDDTTENNDTSKFDFYENKHLDIIHYVGNRFEVRR
jgi:ABC-type branched-subunit amino acid transport system substrate-binding protein